MNATNEIIIEILDNIESVLKERFPDHKIVKSSNSVSLYAAELSPDDLLNILKVVAESNPWIFRHDKGVKVVYFLKGEDGMYLTSKAYPKAHTS